MDFIKKTRSLENYTIRDVEKSLLVDNGHKGLSADTNNYTFYKHNFSTTYTNGVYSGTVNTIVPDTTSDGILYGKVLDIKTDSKGKPILGSDGNPIPNTIDIDIFLNQSFDDMGLFTDMDFVPFQSGTLLLTGNFLDNDYRQTVLQKPPQFNPFIDGRHPATTEDDYEQQGVLVTGSTDDRKLLSVKSYRTDVNGKPLYQNNLNMSKDITIEFNGVTTVNNTATPSYVEYVIGGEVDSNGNYVNGTGVIFKTNFEDYDEKVNEDGKVDRYRKTTFSHTVGGRHKDTNMSLQAIFKQEEFSGVVFPPEVEDNVFIIRGGEDIFERHAIMAEIKTRNDVDEYRDNYF
jgi:hypothetical protein